MPGNDAKVTLVRHDGSLMDATPEQAQRLQLLGYREISDEANAARLREESRADYYTSPDEQVNAALEGISSGLSFGATDYIMGNDETKARAQYNPGLRLATETAGALLPAFLTGGESAALTGAKAVDEAGVVSRFASVAPTNLLSSAAHALAPEASLMGAIARGALEGSVYGGTGAADHVYLDGDPITAETVLHGIGWGTLIGGAISGAGHGIAASGEAAYAEKQAELRAQEPIPKGALNAMAGSEYGALRDEVVNLGAQAKEAVKMADASFKDVTDTLKRANTGYDAVRNFIDTSRPAGIQDAAVNFNNEVRKLDNLYEKAAKAAESGKFDAAKEAIDEYSSHANDIAGRLNLGAHNWVPDPGKALTDLTNMRAIQGVLRDMPKSVEGFASLSAKKLESLQAAIESAKGLPFKNDIDGAAKNFYQAMGIDSASGDILRATQKTAKSVLKSEGNTPKVPPEVDKGPSLASRAAGYAVGAAGGKAHAIARGIGLGNVFVGLKAAALAAIKEGAARWGPEMGRTIEKMGPRTAALAFTIFGQPDTSTKNRQELAAKRAQELYSFAPMAKDAIYKAVEPIAATQPMLAPMMHKTALQAMQAILAMAPKDPGAQSNLKSLWQPSPVQAEVFAKQLAVFHDPIGEAVGMLSTGQLDVTKLTTLKQVAPNIFDELRGAMMQRISQPVVMDKMSYRDQIFVSIALDIPLHTSATPAYIATSQQIFQDRNQPLKANPRIGPGGGLPNPKDNNYATDAQRSTER